MTSSQTLSFNNIEWEVLDTPIARDFSKFLMEEIDKCCVLYTSDAADEGLGVDLGGRRIIK